VVPARVSKKCFKEGIQLLPALIPYGQVSGVPSMVPRVIIVGGGFGGLNAARALRGAPVRVTLIDKRNYHLFRPMLYQVESSEKC
jgi:NADPH-dependent 2,4-dienoyl-CoA reductase/sulfur reductase-like enzyme